MIFRAFTPSDQADFVKLSGDFNPLHADALAARRTMFGAPVVHGIHGVLRALDYWLNGVDTRVELSSLKATFYKPIKVGETLQLEISQHEDSTVCVKILNAHSIATKIIATWKTDENEQVMEHHQTDFPPMTEPCTLSADEIAIDSGTIELPLNSESASALFPTLVKRLPTVQLATILHLSRLVGMRCPGLHSLFSELELTKADDEDSGDMRYVVKAFDRRIGAVVVNICAPNMHGVVKAFRLPSPKVQAGFQELKKNIAPKEFSEQKALIIGGSRGLGEVAAKLLAGGGAEVKITYLLGKSEADEVVADIVSNGGIADCFQYDVLNPLICKDAISALVWKPTHIYYFATPFIFSGSKGKFSAELFRHFCEYYVVGFSNLIDLLIKFQPEKVFYPSSVAIDELPKNMGEYASAKVAGERLCEFLEKCHPELKIYKPRLPRTQTDQTASIIPVTSADPADLMLSELRLFQLQ